VTAICRHPPCEIQVFEHAHRHHGVSWILVIPFVIGILINVISAFTNEEINEKAKAHFVKDAPDDQLKTVPDYISPATVGQSLPWAMDASQIPAVIGTPLIALLVLRSTYALQVIVLYLVVIVGGIVLFRFYLKSVKIYAYEQHGKTKLGHWTPLTIGGVVLNLVAMAIAIIIVK